ncbi:hypothetical protein CLUG_04353 [Clavispora lusitaniae ATCC 42720]|uniref:Uncharacterized protein n=1 Tax=Clavispora lusitaniae (strain ATCC 42720) TaxID=306902 RepID=C4Y825_CLAL4|nr:uncharacterized protein CLUG_04353 [Clavispora lusitaniae ATCC 42720]EEQ40225.1 hypothetical protein CLUG_04353 [Clavispora lusitaniae ATCC 42720]
MGVKFQGLFKVRVYANSREAGDSRGYTSARQTKWACQKTNSKNRKEWSIYIIPRNAMCRVHVRKSPLCPGLRGNCPLSDKTREKAVFGWLSSGPCASGARNASEISLTPSGSFLGEIFSPWLLLGLFKSPTRRGETPVHHYTPGFPPTKDFFGYVASPRLRTLDSSRGCRQGAICFGSTRCRCSLV